MSLVEHRVVEGELAGAVDVDVPKTEVMGGRELYRIREGSVAGDTVQVEIGESDVARIVDVHGQTIGALPAFLFHLQRVDLPVGNVAQLYLVADVVLAGQGIDTAFGRGIRNVDAGLGEAVWRPDVLKSSAAAVGDPEAPIL